MTKLCVISGRNWDGEIELSPGQIMPVPEVRQGGKGVDKMEAEWF